MPKNKGFTLIELLVVISVISFLASITGASLRSAQDKAKEVSRTETKNAVLDALTAYYLDNGTYPNTGGSAYCIGPQTVTCWGVHTGNDALWAQLSPYLTDIPQPDVTPGTYAYNGYKYEAPTTWPGPGALIIWPSADPLSPTECQSPATPDHSDLYYYCFQWLAQ